MSKRRTRTRHLLKLAITVALIGAGTTALWASSLRIPDLASFSERKVAQSTKIYDRTGEVLLYDVHENITRTVVPFSEMSRNIKNATVAIEDDTFYEHRGVRPLAVVRAVLQNLISGDLLGGQGGSTITQQVVKNSLLTQEKSIARKLKEWVLALKLEQTLSKERILELYLNEVPYGGSIYGVEEASRAYFDKPAAELTIAESAYLAALPQAPTFYLNNRDELGKRRTLVLERMFEHGFVTEEEREEAAREEVVFQPRSETGILAPHFVFFVQEYLENTYGRRAVEERGFKIITTLDYKLQQTAEETVEQFARDNEEKFNAENAGLVAVDPKTGQILAMVGSRNYFDEDIDGNFNVALAKRQPGSAFKPFVYATALKGGYTPETVVFDVRTQFSTACALTNLTSEGPCYAPVNYDGTFKGPITFREALAQSINIAAVKVLYLAGLSDSLQTARSLGIQTLTDPARYGLTLVLGGGEVTLLDITSAYGVFANRGVKHAPTAILRIEDGEGDTVEEFEPKQARVLSEQVALQITDILSDNEARAPAFGVNSPLYFPGHDVAAKTGTTNDSRDAWIVGYTRTIAVGAWAGNNDNRPMVKEVAGFIVAPMWHEFVQYALAQFPNEPFDSPLPDPQYNSLKPILRGIWQGGETVRVDTVSGKLATEHTPAELIEERAIPNIHSILYWVDKENPRGGPPENPSADPQFASWELGVARWKTLHGIDESDILASLPTDYDDVHKPEYAPRVSIANPTRNEAYAPEERIAVTIRGKGRFELEKAEYYVDGRFVGSADTLPLTFSFTPRSLELGAGAHTLRAVVYDRVRNRGEDEVVFVVR